MATSAPLGSEITIGHYDFITLFLACKVPQGEEAKKQQQLTHKFDQLCRSFVGERTDFIPAVGQIVGVYVKTHKPNGEWVRGRVEECINQVKCSQYKVFLIDQGLYIKVQRRHVVELNEPMVKTPPASKRIGLYGVLPEASLNQNTRLLLTDFFHRGRLYLKKKQIIERIIFGDISVKQESDGQVFSLTDHLLAQKLVKKVDNFEIEARKFYIAVKAIEAHEEDSFTFSPTHVEVKQEPPSPQALPQNSPSQADASRNQAKDTGYSSSDDYLSDDPFVREDAVFVPAGFNLNDLSKKKDKKSKSKDKDRTPIKTYLQIKMERKKSGEKRSKRPKEVKVKSESDKSPNEKPLANQNQVTEEINNVFQPVFQPRKVQFFGVKSQESNNLPNVEEKTARAFDLNYKSRLSSDRGSLKSEVKMEMSCCDGKFTETGESKNTEDRKNISESTLSTSNCSANFIVSPKIESVERSVKNDSRLSNDSVTSPAGTDYSSLSKKERIRLKLKAGLEARDIVKRYSGGSVGGLCSDESLQNINQSGTSVCSVGEGLDSTSSISISMTNVSSSSHKSEQSEPRRSNIEDTNGGSPISLPTRSSNSDLQGDAGKTQRNNSSPNSSLETSSANCSFQEKRKRLQEKLKRKMEAEKTTDSEASQRDLSASCSQSVCSDDSFIGSSKAVEKPTLASMITVPIEEFEDCEDNVQYVDVSENLTFLRSITTTTGVLVHTKDDRMIPPAISLTDCYLDGNIIQTLERRGKREMNRIQKFSYPVILARRNIVMISPRRSGKTCGYVVPIASNLLDIDYYEKANLPKGNGPLALVITPCWESGAFAAYEFKQTSTQITAIHCYGGGAELELKKELLLGCDVLVTTPRCALRLLDYGVTNLRRLCHLVMDDADVLFDKFKIEMQKLMVAVNSEEVERERSEAKTKVQVQLQVVLAARTWTAPVEELSTRILSRPTLCVASQLEACVYAGVKPTAVFVQNDKKVEKLIDILKEFEGKKRTVVMCRSKEDVKHLHNLLIDLGVRNVIAAHEDLTTTGITEVPGFWMKNENISEEIWNATNSMPIMIRSDQVLEEVPITNANVLIHYNMSNTKKTFSLRFICLMENYHNALKMETAKEKPRVVILLDEKNDLEVPGVMEFMQRLGTILPEPILRTLEDIEKMKDQKRMSEPLCEDIKQFGQCWDTNSCQARHLMTSELDSPCDVPRSGWVKMVVQHIHDASHFSARLLEHAEVKKDQWKRLPGNLSVLPMKLNNYYAVETNRRLHGHPKVGDIVALETSRGVYQRAAILKITEFNRFNQPVRVNVRLIDIGRYDSATVSGTLHLPADLAAPPPAVVDIYLCAVRPKDLDVSWPPAPAEWVQQRLRDVRRDSPDGYLMGKIMLALKGALWLEPVEHLEFLPYMETTVCLLDLRKDLLDTNNATENPGHLPSLRRLCDKAGIQLPPGEKLQFHKPKQPQPQWAWLSKDELQTVHIVTVQDPDVIFLRLNYFADCLQKLTAEIQNFANAQKTNCDSRMMDVGDVCLAKSPESDEWNRALVKSKPAKDKVELFFADFGDTEVVPWTQVKHISNKLITQLPFQVIECYLAGLKFVVPESGGDEWEDDVINMICDLSRNETEEAIHLRAKVCSVETKATYTNGRRYKVVLANCNAKPFVIINKELATSEYVEMLEEETLVENFDVAEVAKDEDSSEEEEEILPSPDEEQSLEVVPYRPNELQDDFDEVENERRVERFLKDLEERDFDCSIFFGIEDDADVSDNASEGSVLSLPRRTGQPSLPGTSSRPALPPPPPDTEDSTSCTSQTIDSSLNSSTLSLYQENNKRETADKTFGRPDLETLRAEGPMAYSSPKCNDSKPNSPVDFSPVTATGNVDSNTSSISNKVTGIANSFKDLIFPNFLNSKSSVSSGSPSLGLVEKVSPFLKRVQHSPLPEHSVCDDFSDSEVDNTITQTDANFKSIDGQDSKSCDSECELDVTVKEMNENSNSEVDDKSDNKESRSSTTDINSNIDNFNKSLHCIDEEKASNIKSVEENKKSPCQKWVECVLPEDSSEDLSVTTRNSMIIGQTVECDDLEVRTPLVEWHQDSSFVTLHIKLPALTKYEFSSDITSVHFSAIYEGIPYRVDLPELFGGHKPEKAQCAVKACYFEIRLEKLLKGKGKNWPRLTRTDKKFHWLKLNADKACEAVGDSDDDDVKRLACSLPLWNDNPTDSNSVASSDRSDLANSDHFLLG